MRLPWRKDPPVTDETCQRCAEIRAKEPADLMFFTPMYMDRCMTPLYYEQEGERVRTMALAMHAAGGHE